MRKNVSNNIFDKRDVILVSVCLFVVVLVLTLYGAYQKSQVDINQVTLEAPPVVKLDVDLSVFKKLRDMTE